MNQLVTAEFFGTPLHIIDHNGKRWLTAEEVAHALGYAEANARIGISNLYNRHADEFTEADTCVVNLTSQGLRNQFGYEPSRGGNPNIRLFSSTGCLKLGFFANTGRAKDFRAWAAKVLDGQPPAVQPVASPSGRGLAITRRIERQVFELFVAGLKQSQIKDELNISPAAVNQMLHAKYRFAPGAGAAECSPALIAAVAARHLEVERARLIEAQERIAQKFLCHANNQPLADALDRVGQQLQTGLPMLMEGGAA